MDIKKQTEYFNERIKPYHVKIRNLTSVTKAEEASAVQAGENLTITTQIFNHDVLEIDTTVGYDSVSFDGLHESIIFKKNASCVNVYVDGLLLSTSLWDGGYWNGTSFNSAPGDNVCNAIQLSSSYSMTKDVWVIGFYATSFIRDVDETIQILAFSDVTSSSPNSNVWFNKNSNSVDVVISTGEHLTYTEGFWNGTVFNDSPVDGICNAVKLPYPLYNDQYEITLTLRSHFAVMKTIPANTTVVSFTGDVKMAYDWPDTNSPGPSDFFFSKIEVNDSSIATTDIIILP